jgi:hypothetical protein
MGLLPPSIRDGSRVVWHHKTVLFSSTYRPDTRPSHAETGAICYELIKSKHIPPDVKGKTAVLRCVGHKAAPGRENRLGGGP